ncbi:uncharacterized protein A1O9_12891 [Exophiala aquamarina CBS 119918]|uniref:DUF3074 domain-containing protein n=1 Tax=Exophiala aquamarina CBS 119918 TaxID=1182545 RepID=A0A072NTQ8_9EURO|nr:uncharacterized protein A1O9_12891 [Exophiala aquamarina CBS 119918]KEF51041.1 hypothetical protein A1O9_12891 [Exophiala aquamarina CBS 119918]
MALKYSNLVRLAPLQVGDLPAHPILPLSEGPRPEVAVFLRSLLDDGCAFLSPSSFSRNFSHVSTKSVADSAAPIEVLTYSIPSSEIAKISWSEGQAVARSKPRAAGVENWIARKSLHQDISGRSAEKPGHASWREFVFGLRDEHSVHESNFTPSLYDARHILDWNDEIKALSTRGEIGTYKEPTMAIYEMCHILPGPLSPRCFPVIVATASVDDNCFVAVTIPVNLGSGVDEAYYTANQNVKDSATSQERKQVVVGVYAAVELVSRNPKKSEIEWIMATASDAKGNLPSWIQKFGVPGQIVKDVGYFLKWIRTIAEEDIPMHV